MSQVVGTICSTMAEALKLLSPTMGEQLLRLRSTYGTIEDLERESPRCDCCGRASRFEFWKLELQAVELSESLNGCSKFRKLQLIYAVCPQCGYKRTLFPANVIIGPVY